MTFEERLSDAAAVFHFVHPVEKTLSASAVKANKFQDAVSIFRMNSPVKF